MTFEGFNVVLQFSQTLHHCRQLLIFYLLTRISNLTTSLKMIDCQDEIVETIASPVRGVVMVTNKNYFSTTSLKKRFSSLNNAWNYLQLLFICTKILPSTNDITSLWTLLFCGSLTQRQHKLWLSPPFQITRTRRYIHS